MIPKTTASAEKNLRIDASGKRLFDYNWEHVFVCYREYFQSMCIICRESKEVQYEATLRLETLKKIKKIDSAYPGKGERLNEFKKRFHVYVSEAKRVWLFAQCASHFSEASYRIYHFLVQN